MTDIAERLQTLATLHGAGHLTDDEFISQKAATLRSTFVDAPPSANYEDADLPAIWQERFAYFDEHGAPNTPSGKRSLRQGSMGQRIRLGGNFKAFFFGIIYLMVLGLWKRAIMVTVFSIFVTAAFGAIGGSALANGAGFGIMAFNMWTTNGAFYRKRRTGRDTWNIFI